MTRSKLKWRYKLDRTTINFEKYKKNVMFVSIFYVNVKNATDNKKFWKLSDRNVRINVKLKIQLF